MIDRAIQEGGTYSGIQGLVAQDQAVTESMGAVVDRCARAPGAERPHDHHDAAPAAQRGPRLARPRHGAARRRPVRRSSAARASGAFLAPEGQDWHEAYLENLETDRRPAVAGARSGVGRCDRQDSSSRRRGPLVSAAAPGTAPARAAWPERPVRIVVPYAPGGPVDLVARLIGDKLATKFGQSFVIENKPGANGAIGVQALMAAPADGYTLLMHGSAGVTIYPAVMKQPAFDTLRDLTPITLVDYFDLILCANPDAADKGR